MMRRWYGGWLAAVVLSAVVIRPAAAAPANVLIVSPHADWLDAFLPLRQWLESEQDTEQHRPWVVETVVAADSTTVRQLERDRLAALGPDGGDLFVLLVADPSREPTAFPQRWLHDPAVAGAHLGWGEDLPVDDLYADVDDDGTVDAICFRLPAWSAADCQVYVAKDLAFRAAVQEQPDWLRRVDIVAEDFGRLGHSGSLVRRHGQALQETWSGWFQTVYTGDATPYDYDQREATADSLDNLGHQFKITLGTEANKVDLVNFQDLRLGWSEQHLAPTGRCFFHLALSCAHHAVDRADHYGRPLAERFLFVPQAGAVASLGFTRQAREWVHYWMGDALARAVVAGIHNPPVCRTTIGRCWRRAQDTFRAEHPEHASEYRSFCGLGDPTLPVTWFATPTAVAAGGPVTPSVTVSPNPCRLATAIRVTAAAKTVPRLVIRDLAGRTLRRLGRFAGKDGATMVWHWDGRDDHGRPVASGCYIVSVTVGNRRVERKVAVVR